MSKAYNSPTARLLQHSRLFSLPKPLPKPELEGASYGGKSRGSQTATLPYPTHQAIETPDASRFRGDWGLKRSLPTRTTTRSGTPTVRVLAQDTSDHVTDFASAGDHERTLAKFQELGIPLLRRDDKSINSFAKANEAPSISVYEDRLDSTDSANVQSRRWKQLGPTIGRIEAGELAGYLQRIRKMRPEWEQFLANSHAQKMLRNLKVEMRSAKGYEGPFEAQDPAFKRDHVESAEEDGGNMELKRQEYAAEVEYWTRIGEAIENFDRIEIRALENERHARQRAVNEAALDQQMSHEERDEFVNAKVAEANEEMVRLRLNAYKVISRSLEADFDVATEDNAYEAIASEDVESNLPEDAALEDSTADELSLEKARSRAQAFIAAARAAQQSSLEQRAALRKQWDEITLASLTPDKQQLQQIIKQLRDEHAQDGLSSELSSLLTNFLDLAGLNMESSEQANKYARSEAFQNHLLTTISPTTVAQTTHPGAGLGYLRTNSYMANHAVWGPQAQRSPVQSRVLRPRKTARGTQLSARIGVGGFVGNDPLSTSYNDARSLMGDDGGTAYLDPTLSGGNKVWMHTQYASIDGAGRVKLGLLRPEKEATAVKTGDVQAVLESKRNTLVAQSPPALQPRSSAFGANRSWGLQSGSAARDGAARDRQALERIQELSRR